MAATFLTERPLCSIWVARMKRHLRTVEKAYYVAELGRVPVVRGFRIGAFLFELLMLIRIAQSDEEFILNTAEFGDLARTKDNPAKRLYESHGYTRFCDKRGNVLTRSFSKERACGEIIVDVRPYYYATADSFLSSVGLTLR